MIGPEVFSATGYFDNDPQCETIEKTVGRQLQRKLSKYHCQEWRHGQDNGIHEIQQTVVVMPFSYYRAFAACARGEEPNLNMKSVLRGVDEQLEKI